MKMPVSENDIRKKAQRLARADGKQLGLLPMLERRAYLERAKAALVRGGDGEQAGETK
jgi:hypothetical protein